MPLQGREARPTVCSLTCTKSFKFMNTHFQVYLCIVEARYILRTHRRCKRSETDYGSVNDRHLHDMYTPLSALHDCKQHGFCPMTQLGCGACLPVGAYTPLSTPHDCKQHGFCPMTQLGCGACLPVGACYLL
jgi:hypothetical protein